MLTRLILVVAALVNLACAQTVNLNATAGGVYKSVPFALKPQSSLTFALDDAVATSLENPVVLNLVMTTTRIGPASFQFSLVFDPAVIASVSVVAGPATTAAGKTLQCNATPGKVKCIAAAVNKKLVGAGTVAVATVAFVGSGAPVASTVVQLTEVVAAPQTGSGPLVITSLKNGTITFPVQLLSLTCSAAEIEPQELQTCTVTLTVPAATGGQAVGIFMSEVPSGVTFMVPESVVVPAGSTSATFDLIRTN